MDKKHNWILSFKSLKFKRKDRNERTLDENTVTLRRNLPNNSIEESTTSSRKNNSFRKSFIKFQSRFKNVMSRNKSYRHTIHNTNVIENITPIPSPRVTLQSPIKRAENIYSLDPVKENPKPSIVNINCNINLQQNYQQLRPQRSQSFTVNHAINSLNAPRHHAAEIDNLSQCYWYWGPLSRTDAEEKLRALPDGSFLIRDSSSSSYLFSISFRSVGRTLHSRIEHTRGRYGLYDQEGYNSIRELVDHAMRISSENIYCYTKSGDNNPNYPVRLIKPISRFTSVRPLKYLCRFVIRQCTNMNQIPKLPLPASIKEYLQEEGPYF